jgi:hypothetical protein
MFCLSNTALQCSASFTQRVTSSGEFVDLDFLAFCLSIFLLVQLVIVLTSRDTAQFIAAWKAKREKIQNTDTFGKA